MRGEKGREESNFSGGGIGQGARKFFERGEKGREKKISEEGGPKKIFEFFLEGGDRIPDQVNFRQPPGMTPPQGGEIPHPSPPYGHVWV